MLGAWCYRTSVAISVYRPLNDRHIHLPSSVSSSLPSSLLTFLHLFRSVLLLKIVPLLALLTNPELPLIATCAAPFKLSLIMVMLLDPALTKSSAWGWEAVFALRRVGVVVIVPDLEPSPDVVE